MSGAPDLSAPWLERPHWVCIGCYRSLSMAPGKCTACGIARLGLDREDIVDEVWTHLRNEQARLSRRENALAISLMAIVLTVTFVPLLIVAELMTDDAFKIFVGAGIASTAFGGVALWLSATLLEKGARPTAKKLRNAISFHRPKHVTFSSFEARLVHDDPDVALACRLLIWSGASIE